MCVCVCVHEGPADQPEPGRVALQTREPAGGRAPPRRVRAQAECAQGRERQTELDPEVSSALFPLPLQITSFHSRIQQSSADHIHMNYTRIITTLV